MNNSSIGAKKNDSAEARIEDRAIKITASNNMFIAAMNDCSLIDLGPSKSDDDDKIDVCNRLMMIDVCTSNNDEAGFEGEEVDEADDQLAHDDDAFLQLFDTELFQPSEFLSQSYLDLETASEVSFYII